MKLKYNFVVYLKNSGLKSFLILSGSSNLVISKNSILNAFMYGLSIYCLK